jgi:(p)ppGpp synthase/HD superfamily hydrolase
MVNRERIVEVEWAGRPEKTAYAVKLLAITENRTGMIAGITGAISDMKTGIRDARASVCDNFSIAADHSSKLCSSMGRSSNHSPG